MKISISSMLFLLLTLLPGLAQGPATYAVGRSIDRRCAAAGSMALPTADLPTADERKRFSGPDVDCELLHFVDKSKEPDWASYRACVLSRPGSDTDTVATAELYANGWGVRVNLPLARVLVCRSDYTAPAEVELMLDDLDQRANRNNTDGPFRYCSYVTSGRGAGGCAWAENRLNQARRNVQRDAATRNWTPAQKKALGRLVAATDAFAAAHAEGEVDVSGSGAGMYTAGADAAVQTALTQVLVEAGKGLWPKRTDTAAALAEMKQALHEANEYDWTAMGGTIILVDVHKAQASWERYRKAWQELARLVAPAASPTGLDSWLYRVRARQLRETMGPQEDGEIER